jgi:hypothetical protein
MNLLDTCTIVSNDPNRFKTYFPSVKRIEP